MSKSTDEMNPSSPRLKWLPVVGLVGVAAALLSWKALGPGKDQANEDASGNTSKKAAPSLAPASLTPSASGKQAVGKNPAEAAPRKLSESRRILEEAAEEYFGDQDPQLRGKDGSLSPVTKKSIARELKLQHFKEALLRKELKKRPALHNQARQALLTQKPALVTMEWPSAEGFSAVDVLVEDTVSCGIHELKEKNSVKLDQLKGYACLYQGSDKKDLDQATGPIRLGVEKLKVDSPRWKRLARKMLREKVASEFVANAKKP